MMGVKTKCAACEWFPCCLSPTLLMKLCAYGVKKAVTFTPNSYGLSCFLVASV